MRVKQFQDNDVSYQDLCLDWLASHSALVGVAKGQSMSHTTGFQVARNPLKCMSLCDNTCLWEASKWKNSVCKDIWWVLATDMEMIVMRAKGESLVRDAWSCFFLVRCFQPRMIFISDQSFVGMLFVWRTSLVGGHGTCSEGKVMIILPKWWVLVYVLLPMSW